MLPFPTTTTTLEKIQSCWQIPYIAHFCTLFNKYLDLPSFDTEDLEQALLRDPLKENLVPELITRLLRRCHETKRIGDRIGTNTFEPFLELFTRKTCEAEKRANPYHVAAAAANRNTADEGPLSFEELPVEQQAEVIQLLCETRFVAEDAQELIEQANPDSLRVLPLGYDSSAAAYYYFFGTRLYRESNRLSIKKERKDEFLLNGSLQLNGSAIHEDSVRYLATSTAEPEAVRWELVCQTETDWTELTRQLAKSKKTKAECALVKVLEENFLPNISNLFRTKEKNEKFNINKYVPVRSSSRVRVLAELKQKQKEEEEKEQQKEQNEKYNAVPLKRNVPFESQFRWSDGVIQAVAEKRRISTPDPNADAENGTRRSTRQPKQPKVNEREERARKRGHVEIKPEINSESESEEEDSS